MMRESMKRILQSGFMALLRGVDAQRPAARWAASHVRIAMVQTEMSRQKATFVALLADMETTFVEVAMRLRSDSGTV